MKHNILFFFFFISICTCVSQTITPKNLNFKLNEDENVIWNKNYKYNLNKDSLSIILQAHLKGKLFTKNLNLTDYGLIGQTNKILLSSTKNMAIGARNPYSASIKIEIIDGNYLVSITNIIFDGLQFDYPLIGKKSVGKPHLLLKDFVVKKKKHEFRKNNGAMNLLTALNNDFDKYFALK